MADLTTWIRRVAAAVRGSTPMLSAALWAPCLAVTAYGAYRSYLRAQIRTRDATDFQIYFAAAREIAGGHSPYLAKGFVYPPIFPLLLSPLVHGSSGSASRVWTIVSIVAIGVAAACLVATEAKRLRTWMFPLFFAGCALSAYEFFPFKFILLIGQSDAMVLAVLAVAMIFIERRFQSTVGALLGLTGVMKAWPAVGVLYLFRRGNRDLSSDVLAYVVALAVAPIMALVLGGWSELSQMRVAIFDARSQSGGISDSVWGIPRLLFSPSGLARQVTDSSILRGAATVFLLLWVLSLLIVILRNNGEGTLVLWEVMACIVLLLPVSHEAYSLYALPVIWIRASRLVSAKGRNSISFTVFAILGLWWLAMVKSWPSDGWPATISSIRFSVVFFANLGAITASVVGDRFLSARQSTNPVGRHSRSRQSSSMGAGALAN